MAVPKPTLDKLVLLADAGIEPELVNAQVERLCRSTALENKGNAKKLLRYLVKCQLARYTPNVEEVTLKGIGRQTFSPRDSIARNTARKLREILEDHYGSPEAQPDEIWLQVEQGGYAVLTPRVEGVAAAASTASHFLGRVQARILEPYDMQEVYRDVVVRGRIDLLNLDLRVWLVVLASGWHYLQCRVSRALPEWQRDVRIGTVPWGQSDGCAFDIFLVAADIDGDFAMHEHLRMHGDGLGMKMLPTDSWIIDRKRVIRRDIRSGSA